MLKKKNLQQSNEHKKFFPHFLTKNFAKTQSLEEYRRTKDDDHVFLPRNQEKRMHKAKRKSSFKRWLTGVLGKREHVTVRLRSVSALSEDEPNFTSQKTTNQCLHVSLSAPESTVRDNYPLSTQQAKTINCRNHAVKANYLASPRPRRCSNGAKQEKARPRRRKVSVNSRPRYPYDVTRRSSRAAVRRRHSSSNTKKTIVSNHRKSKSGTCVDIIAQGQVFENPSSFHLNKTRLECFNKRQKNPPQAGSKECDINHPWTKSRVDLKENNISTNPSQINLKNTPKIQHTEAKPPSEGFKNVTRRAKRFLSRHGNNSTRKRRENNRLTSCCEKVRLLIKNSSVFDLRLL